MKTQHTPGPWTSKPTASLGPQYAVYPESDGHDIAIIYDHGNTEANARLIAAAPELLQTLQDAQEVLAVALAWPNSNKIRRQIRDAISKATQP